VMNILLVDQVHDEVDVMLERNDVRPLHVLKNTVHDVEVCYLLSICVLLRRLNYVKSFFIPF
jgi:hypothetical protein